MKLIIFIAVMSVGQPAQDVRRMALTDKPEAFCRLERTKLEREPFATFCLERLPTGGLLPIAMEW